MNQIQIADHKTLKLTNVLWREYSPDDMNNLGIVVTQMENYIKSNGAQPIGPLVQHTEVSTGPKPEAKFYLLRQATNFIPRTDPGYHMDAVLRVKGCLYAHYTGPMSKSQFAGQKLSIYAFENDVELRNSMYTVFVNQDDDDAVIDVFMETAE